MPISNGQMRSLDEKIKNMAKEDLNLDSYRLAVSEGWIDESESLDIEESQKESLEEYIKTINTEEDPQWQPPQPASDAKIWRYISFTQLLSILEKESIRFTRAGSFDDPYEGMIPKPNLEKRAERVSEIVDSDKKTAKSLLSAFEISNMIDEGLVNCWNISRHESAALWEQYLEASQGVAITSEAQKLKESMPEDREFIFGEVEYIDYKNDEISKGIIPPLYHKRNSFEHENEFRVTFMPEEDESLGKGEYISVDVDTLIDEIYFPPVSQDWFFDLIKDVIDTYGVDCEFKESEILSRPGYGP